MTSDDNKIGDTTSLGQEISDEGSTDHASGEGLASDEQSLLAYESEERKKLMGAETSNIIGLGRHKYYIQSVCMWLGISLAIIFIASWSYHILAPEHLHWMLEDKIDVIGATILGSTVSMLTASRFSTSFPKAPPPPR